MNKKRAFILTAVILVLSGLIAIANKNQWLDQLFGNPQAALPDAKEELKKLYAIYSKQETPLDLKGTVKLYDGENKDVLKEQKTFSYSRKGKRLFSQFDYLRTFLDDSLVVQIDTANKYIAISKIVDDEQETIQSGFPFEKFMHDTSAFKVTATLSEKNKERALTMVSELNPEIKASVIYYDPVTYKIRKAEIEWWKDAVVENNPEAKKRVWLTVMEYTYPAPGTIPVPGSIHEIITWKDGKPEPVKAYKDYQVHVSF